MSQSLSLPELRDRLELLLEEYLGRYPSGQKAVWVCPPEPPSVPNEIQCLIQRVPESRIDFLSAGQRYSDRNYVLILTNFNRETSLSSALDKIVANLPVRQYTYMPITEQSYEQARLLVYDPVVINGV
ncbi:MAG: hypothetical protein F6K50_02715 [Moorea sp. SIO3I7]|uniref:hypothetical protein n=1 Tax=Moorena sp. SIO3I8 TaxID=2607833 RepID=UPI0013C0EC2B|nr:hypothetical protein [Moorena sp. SIO3I8]NEN94474.1 hypothetical protein [Moorena sp. SIO3I7]NEO04920.1 hypothetical protein [Moorena sp. SIO3I8]NEP48479.1 hypothetical protein [Moorena sp. SIO3C2]NES80785.1 hypothetical protein [Moorena sp. SIO2B7]